MFVSLVFRSSSSSLRRPSLPSPSPLLLLVLLPFLLSVLIVRVHVVLPRSLPSLPSLPYLILIIAICTSPSLFLPSFLVPLSSSFASSSFVSLVLRSPHHHRCALLPSRPGLSRLSCAPHPHRPCLILSSSSLLPFLLSVLIVPSSLSSFSALILLSSLSLSYLILFIAIGTSPSSFLSSSLAPFSSSFYIVVVSRPCSLSLSLSLRSSLFSILSSSSSSSPFLSIAILLACASYMHTPQHLPTNSSLRKGTRTPPGSSPAPPWNTACRLRPATPSPSSTGDNVC